jgi:uncharacterized phosphosugar-binding protein
VATRGEFAQNYLDEVIGLVRRLQTDERAGIEAAGDAVAAAIESGGRVWVPVTAHGIAHELTRRAGGFVAVHVLADSATVRPGDCLLIGSPVGTATHTIDFALRAKQRSATIVALTNLAFEKDPATVLAHPSGGRLHEIADIVIDIAGPLGDGVFSLDQVPFPVVPHSGVTLVAGFWAIHSHALEALLDRGLVPRMYECDLVQGARARNAEQLNGYFATGLGYVTPGERASVLGGVDTEGES